MIFTKIILSGIPSASECQTNWIQMRPDTLNFAKVSINVHPSKPSAGLFCIIQSVQGGDRKINVAVKDIFDAKVIQGVFDRTEGMIELDAPYHGILLSWAY